MASSSVIGVLKALLTADTAQFDAAMAKSAATTQKTAKGIHTISDEIAKLTPQAERMAKAFAGDKLLYSANSMVQAVAKIGGATKLTIAEQAKVNAKLTEAIGKYKVLGQTAPAAMLALHKATLAAVPPTQTLTARTVALAAAFGSFVAGLATNAIYAAGRAILAMAKNAFESAGQMIDLSVKTGLTTDTLQRMAFVAKQSGTDIEAMTRASFQLGVRIANSSDEVRKAVRVLQQYGVQWEILKTQTADQQWETIVAALSKVESATERNRLGVMLFGKTWGEIAAAAAQDYKKTADAADVATERQLKALDQLGNDWDAMWSNVGTGIQKFVGQAGEMVLAIKEITAETGLLVHVWNIWGLVQEANNRIAMGTVNARKTNIDLLATEAGLTQTYTQQLAELRKQVATLTAEDRRQIDAAKDLGEKNEDIAVTLNKVKRETVVTAEMIALYTSQSKAATKSTKEWSLGFATITAALKEMQLRMLRLTDEQKAEIAAGKELGLSTEQIASTMKIATQVVDLYADSLKDAAEFAKALTVANTDLSQISIGRGDMEGEIKRQDAHAETNDVIIESRQRRAKVEEDIATKQMEHEIEMAKMAGASWQQIYLMERALSERKLELAKQDAEREFQIRAAMLDRSTADGEAAYQELQREHESTIRAMTEDWENGEAEKIEALKHTHDIFTKTMDNMRDLGQTVVQSISDGFADMLVGARTFKDGMLDIWHSIQRSIAQILSDILKSFLTDFLGGMVKGIAAAKLGEQIGSSLASGVASAAGGSGGGGGGSSLAQQGIQSGASILMKNPQLLANPYVATAAAIIIGGTLLYKHFKGNKGNDIRDKDLAQFATFDTHRDANNPPGFYGLDAFLSKYKKHDLFVNFVKAKGTGDIRKAWKPIVEFTATKGRDLKSFAMGGFVPPGAVVPAILHGGSFGEDIKPRSAPAGGSSAVHMTWHVHAIDAKGISDLVKSDAFKRTLSREIQLDGPLRVGHRRALVGY